MATQQTITLNPGDQLVIMVSPGQAPEDAPPDAIDLAGAAAEAPAGDPPPADQPAPASDPAPAAAPADAPDGVVTQAPDPLSVG